MFFHYVRTESGKQVDPLTLGRLSVEATQNVYNPERFTAEYLKAVANLGTVNQIAELMFNGNIEAAQAFKQKYVSSSNYAQIDLPNVILGTADNYTQVERARTAQPIYNGKDISPLSAANGQKDAVTKSVDGNAEKRYNNGTNLDQDNGGNDNAGQGLLRNGSERSGRASANSESGTGTVQETNGGVYGDSQNNWVSGEHSEGIRDSSNRRLTADQKERYDATILKYKSSESYKINSKLREDDVLTEEEQEFVNTLDEALEQLPTYEGTVYRQIIFDDFGKDEFDLFLSQHVPGQPIFYKQYISCSTTEDGYELQGNLRVKFIVEGKSARNVDGYGNNMEHEVVFPRNTVFIVQDIDTSGQYPIIYLQEDVENGYNTNEEQGDAVRDLQASHSVYSDMQGIPAENTSGNTWGRVRPQSSAPGGQRNTLRAEGGQGALLSAEGKKQEVISVDESSPTGGRVLDMPAITVRQQNYIRQVGKALGLNVEFVNMEKFLREHDVNTEGLKVYPDGAIDGKGNVYIAYNTKRALQFVFKHELTHFGERSKHYKAFVNVVRESKVYLAWLKATTKMENASREVMEAELMKRHREARNGLARLSYDAAMNEIIADFVGEKCFGENLEDINELVSGVTEIKEKNAAVRFLHDFFLWLKNKLADHQLIRDEISLIEQNFAQMLADTDNTKPSTENGRGLKYSIATDSEGVFVRIDTNQEVFDGKSVGDMQEIAKNIILDNFKGKVVSVGNDGKAYVNKRSAEEYAYPANRRMDEEIKKSKMRASAEFENLLSVSKFIENEPDDGRHPDATGGWDKYLTRFEVGGQMFEGDVKIKVTDRGCVFYDISKIKRTARKAGLTENNSAAASGNPSMDSITDNGTPVNSNSMQESDNHSSGKDDLSFSVPTSTESERGLRAVAENGRITTNMSEAGRAAILKTKGVKLVKVENSVLNEEFDFADLESNIKSKVEKSLLKKFQELGLLKKYKSLAISDVEFDFTGKGVRKSLNSQETAYGGSKADFTKAVIHLQELLDNAVLIETHTDKGEGTAKEQRGLKQVYVLLSAMREGNTVIPVQFEIKQYIDDNNRLYLAVALTKIEIGVVGNTASEKQMATSLIPISNISIPELFSKINPKDGKFLKYIPDEFLNASQIEAKKQALSEDETKYGLRFSVSTSEQADADVKTDFPSMQRELLKKLQNGEISGEEYAEKIELLWEKALEEAGEIKPGEKVSAENKDIPVPKSVKEGTKVRQHVRTILESGMATAQQEEWLKAHVLSGELSYTPTSDKKRIKDAENTISKLGYQIALNNWQTQNGGVGLGLERIVQNILGLDNIKQATAFPRDRDRIRP